MKTRVGILFFILCFLPIELNGAVKTTAKAQEHLSKFQEAWDTIKTFQAKYQQKIADLKLKTNDEKVGSLFLLKPDRVRWECETDKSELLVNPQQIVQRQYNRRRDNYSVDITANDGKQNDTPLFRFLSGKAPLKEIYRPSLVSETPKIIKLKLTSVDPKVAETLIAEIDKQSYLPLVLTVETPQSRISIAFSEVVKNPPLDPSRFEFTPGPKDKVH